MKSKQTAILASLALGVATLASSCAGNPKKVTPVEYDGATTFAAVTDNLTADTVAVIDSVNYPVVLIQRSASAGDNFSISLDIEAPANSPEITGALKSYISQLMATFAGDELQDPILLGTDSIAPTTTAELAAYADFVVAEFKDKIAPQAQSDSVIGTNVVITLKPVFVNDSYVTYAMASDLYLGGANSLTDFYLQTYAASTGRPMGFYNLVPATDQARVKEELLASIASKSSQSIDQYLASVNQWVGADQEENWTLKTFPIYHVGITAQGYVFAYPKYSIAPGSDGVQVFVVPAGK